MPTFSVSQIIGKNLIAASPVALKRQPTDAAPVIFTVLPGQPVGVVDSYLMPKAGRSRLYWAFIDSTGRPYYSEHRQGLYSLSALKDQGTITVKEQTEQQQEQQQTTAQVITKNITRIAIIIGAAIVLKNLLPNLFKGK